MKKWTGFIISIILVISVLTACGSSASPSFKTISLKDAKQMVDQGVQVIDVRTAGEYAQGHIPKAKNISLQDIQANPKSALKDLKSDQKYIIICHSGSRSLQASKIMASNGFTNIFNTETGMMNWKYEVTK